MTRGFAGSDVKSTSYPTPIGYLGERSECVCTTRILDKLNEF